MAAEQISVDASEAVKGIDDLNSKMQKSIVRKSLRAGCNVIKPAAKADAPERTGALKKLVKVRTLGARRGIYRMSVGIKSDAAVPYPTFVLFGHRVGRRALGDGRTSVPANDFIKSAYDAKKDAAVSKIEETGAALIEEASQATT